MPSANFLQPLLNDAKIGDTVECPPSITELDHVWEVTETIVIPAGVSFHAGPNCIFWNKGTGPAFMYDGGTLALRPDGTPDTAAARDELPTRIGGGMIIFGPTGHAASSCFEVRNARNVIIDGLTLCPRGDGIKLDGFDVSRLHNVAIQPAWVRRLISSFGHSPPGARHTTKGIYLRTDNWPAALVDIENLHMWGGTTAVECVETRQPLGLVTVRGVVAQNMRSDSFVVRVSPPVRRDPVATPETKLLVEPPPVRREELLTPKISPVVQFLLEDVYAENLPGPPDAPGAPDPYFLRASYVDHLVVKRIRAAGRGGGNRVKLQNCQRVHFEDIKSFVKIKCDPIEGMQFTAINVEAGDIVRSDGTSGGIKNFRNYAIFGARIGGVGGYSPHQLPTYSVDELSAGVLAYAEYRRRRDADLPATLPPSPLPEPVGQLVYVTDETPVRVGLAFSGSVRVRGGRNERHWFRVSDASMIV